MKHEGKRMVKECWNVLDSMGNNKSPGNDGFTKEFYLAFFNYLNRYLVDKSLSGRFMKLFT